MRLRQSTHLTAGPWRWGEGRIANPCAAVDDCARLASTWRVARSPVCSQDRGSPAESFEAGYEIGCGIDMSTSNGVTMAGSAGLSPSLGVSGPIGGLPTTVVPVLSTPVNGVITVGLKPGLVVVVPVDKKEFKSPSPWIMIRNFHVKIDGCVGQSFIRSYATLTRQTDESDVVLSYVGVTTTV